jgi:hypothetical protein
VEGGQHLPKAYGIKMRCYGEHVGEHLTNLAEHIGNLKGTYKEPRKNEKKIPRPPQT